MSDPGRWLEEFLPAMALEFALRSGLIEALASGTAPPMPPALAAILQRAGVMEGGTLSAAFRTDWTEAGAQMVARASFLRLAARDLILQGDSLWSDLAAFMPASDTFRFFDYAPAYEGRTDGPTKAWVAYVSALTEAEAPRLVPHLSLPPEGHLLEIGGNAGAMARELLTQHTGLRVTVLDLPGVCHLAETDPRNRALAGRLSFVAGDLRQADLRAAAPGALDVILLKSVLHDWPEAEARDLVRRALGALAPGGRLVIAERAAFVAEALPDLSMQAVGNVVFSAFYRDAGAYVGMIRDAAPGARITVTDLMLDMRWHVVTAQV